MTECFKCTRLENPRWWRPLSSISKNVNNSEFYRAIRPPGKRCKRCIYYTNVGNIINALTSIRALNFQIFSLSLCRTHLFALLSRLLIRLFPSVQSAYRKCHFMETAMARVLSDILMALDRGDVAALALLDLLRSTRSITASYSAVSVNRTASVARRSLGSIRT